MYENSMSTVEAWAITLAHVVIIGSVSILTSLAKPRQFLLMSCVFEESHNASPMQRSKRPPLVTSNFLLF